MKYMKVCEKWQNFYLKTDLGNFFDIRSLLCIYFAVHKINELCGNIYCLCFKSEAFEQY